MPSGKQVSFEFGEVSPTLHFRSDAVSYSQGLSKLKNMFVRKEGGVSNRPGFKFVRQHDSQNRVPAQGENASIKGFTFFVPNSAFIQSIENVSQTLNVSSITSLGSNNYRYNLSGTLDANWAIGIIVNITGCTNPNNNGLKVVTAFTTNSFTVNNASGAAQAGAAGSVNNLMAEYVLDQEAFPPEGTDDYAYVYGVNNALNGGQRLVVRVDGYSMFLNYGLGTPTNQTTPNGILESTLFRGKGRWATLEYVPSATVNTTAPNGTSVSTDSNIFVLDRTMVSGNSILGNLIFSTAPSKIRFTKVKNKIFISPSLQGVPGSSYPFLEGNAFIDTTPALSLPYGYLDVNKVEKDLTLTDLTGESLNITTASKTFVTGTLAAPVAYLITAVMLDGREVRANYTDSSINTGLAHPTADLSVKFTYTLTAAVPDIKYFNVYRAAGEPGLSAFKRLIYNFAGRIAYDGAATTLTFDDYGAGNPAVSPPLDSSMFNENGVLSGAECATYYQQRLVLGMRHGASETIKNGDLLASMIGAEEQFQAPVIYNNVGAFQFSVPIQDGTPVVALLSIQGLIAFTEKNVYLIRGADGSGQGGVITPTEVNPVLVSSEGCSKTVEPKSSGTKGFFINSSHTKLMAIGVGADGGVEIADASLFSEHTLYGDITELAVISGVDDVVYLLRRDGKLVRVTITGTGVFGFSVIETEGYIESIYTGKAKREYAPNTVSADAEKYHDVLMAYVIRNGVRTIEQLVYREDRQYEAEYFADCFSSFGQRLADDGNNGYSANVNNYAANPGAGEINIVTTVVSDYSAGTEMELEMPAVTFADPNFVLHFFYENSDGEKCTIRFHSNGNAKAGNSYFGYFDEDLPAVLQDVDSQSISAYEKKRRKTRWLPAYNKIEGDDVLLGPWIASNNGENPVSVMADGEIISSPLNPNKQSLYITEVLGVKTLILPDYYCFGYVGVPYESEFETLDLEDSSARTLSSDNKLINAVGVGFNQTRAGFFGTPSVELNQMEELVYREESSLNLDSGYLSGYLEVNFPSVYTRSGRVSIKNVDPAPISVLSVYPKGISGA